MAPMDIRSRADFDAALKKAPNQLLVIDFHATWCGPCKQIAPLYAQLAERYKASAVFYRCDIDQVPDVWKLQGAEGVPTFSFYAKGARVESFSGADPKRLEDTVKRLSEKYKGFAFGGGSGYSLSGGKATGSASGSAAAAPAAGRGAGGAGGAAAGGPPRRNPWADPNFVPKGSQLHSKGEDAGAAKKADGKAADKPKPKTESPLVALAKERAANPKPAAAPAPAAAAKPAEKPAEAKPAAAPAAAVVSEPKPAAASASASASAMDVDKPAGAAAADAAPAAAAPAASDAAPAAKPTVNDPSLTKGLNQQTLNELLGMGFTQIRAEKALILTAAKGRAATLEGAIDWLGAHGDDADIDEPLTVVATKPKAGAAAAADFDDSELDDEMKKIVRAARAAPKEGAGGAGGAAASDAPVKKSTADMTSEEKQKWLDDRRAAVKAKREAEAREREKESEKNRREVAKAAAKAKEVKETVVAVDSWAVKRKEEADKKAARKRALEKIKQAREEKASRDAMYLAQEKEKAAAAKAAAAGGAKPK